MVGGYECRYESNIPADSVRLSVKLHHRRPGPQGHASIVALSVGEEISSRRASPSSPRTEKTGLLPAPRLAAGRRSPPSPANRSPHHRHRGQHHPNPSSRRRSGAKPSSCSTRKPSAVKPPTLVRHVLPPPQTSRPPRDRRPRQRRPARHRITTSTGHIFHLDFDGRIIATSHPEGALSAHFGLIAPSSLRSGRVDWWTPLKSRRPPSPCLKRAWHLSRCANRCRRRRSIPRASHRRECERTLAGDGVDAVITNGAVNPPSRGLGRVSLRRCVVSRNSPVMQFHAPARL